jgi:hypothetical protein
MFELTVRPGHKIPCIEIENTGWKLHAFLKRALFANHWDDPFYQAKLKAAPFFQCGSHETEGYALIEFWGHDVEEYINFLNQEWEKIQ